MKVEDVIANLKIQGLETVSEKAVEMNKLKTAQRGMF